MTSKILDNDIREIVWRPVFMFGDRRVLDLILALDDGWVNISYDEDNNDFFGDNPNCEMCREKIPYIHNSEVILRKLLRPMYKTLCIHADESITIHWGGPENRKESFKNKTVLDNLLFAYMEALKGA